MWLNFEKVVLLDGKLNKCNVIWINDCVRFKALDVETRTFHGHDLGRIFVFLQWKFKTNISMRYQNVSKPLSPSLPLTLSPCLPLPLCLFEISSPTIWQLSCISMNFYLQSLFRYSLTPELERNNCAINILRSKMGGLQCDAPMVLLLPSLTPLLTLLY